jgi:Transposase
VTATMTWVGLDVHARSTHAAAIDRESGELRRARFGAGVEEVTAWLRALPQPIHGCYEAGPTGYALYRAAEAAGLRVDVVAPSKTPRAAADRVKTDRKDAELLVRLLLAGSLSVVAVPPASFEAARDLARAREQVRADLARLRHRVSKLLLRYGRVYDGGGTWTQAHRRWLPPSGSTTSRPNSPTSTRWPRSTASSPAGQRSTNGSRCSQPSRSTGRLSSGCAASAASRRSRRSSCISRSATSPASNAPASSPPGSDSCPRYTSRARARRAARSPRPAPASPAASSSRQPGTTCANRASAPRSPTGRPASPTTSSRSPGGHNTASTGCSDGCAPAADPATSPSSPPHAS